MSAKASAAEDGRCALARLAGSVAVARLTGSGSGIAAGATAGVGACATHGVAQRREIRHRRQAAGIVEHQAFADAVEHALSQLRLQLRQSCADRRLRHRQRITRGRGAAAMRDFHQHLHLPQGQPHDVD